MPNIKLDINLTLDSTTLAALDRLTNALNQASNRSAPALPTPRTGKRPTLATGRKPVTHTTPEIARDIVSQFVPGRGAPKRSRAMALAKKHNISITNVYGILKEAEKAVNLRSTPRLLKSANR